MRPATSVPLEHLAFFAESGINTPSIDHLFSCRLLRSGDLIEDPEKETVFEVKMVDEQQHVIKAKPSESLNLDISAYPNEIDLPFARAHRLIRRGDAVEISAGKYKGESGLVVEVDGKDLTIINDNGESVSTFLLHSFC